MKKVTCPKCGREVYESETYCPFCTARITPAVAETARPAPPPQAQGTTPQAPPSQQTLSAPGLPYAPTVQKRFQSLRFIAGLTELLAFLMVTVGGLILVVTVLNWSQIEPPSARESTAMSGALCLASSLGLLVYAEMIQVVLAIEENTRASEENTRWARFFLERMSPRQ